MNTLTIKHSNGNETSYQLIDDNSDLPIAYHSQTNQKVIEVLEKCRKQRRRVKLFLGDIETGRDWKEEFGVVGYIGLSRGKDARYPILVYNSRSLGGGSVLDHCIVKIQEAKGKTILYQAENYHI